MSRLPAIAEEHAAQEAQPQARAKALPRAAESATSMLGGAIADAGASMRGVARAVGVDESILRRIDAGRRPLTVARILSFPRGVALAVVQRMIAAIDSDAPPSGLTAEGHALRNGELVGLVCAELRAALADGKFTRDERVAVLRAVRREIAELHRWELDLERAIREEG